MNAQREFVASDVLRAQFSAAMSAMYKAEVPAYGTLVELVNKINGTVLKKQDVVISESDVNRLSQERHGAIRLGTASELAMMRRVFAVMGMLPVGYYDLATAGIPVHSTAFRPIDYTALSSNPFRVFTSLIRLDLIDDVALHRRVSEVLAQRQIFNSAAINMVKLAERQGGLDTTQAEQFIDAVLEIFRWHGAAAVDFAMYQDLHQQHRLLADVVSFQGPHINHLTPRTLDIDAAQQAMPAYGIESKAVVEGPPPRHCSILLRQTSFKALEESVQFPTANNGWVLGHHTARFGEIEQRGVALTPKGRALYDTLLARVRSSISLAADGSNANEYRRVLKQGFVDFPDDWDELRKQQLAYFRYIPTEKQATKVLPSTQNIEVLITARAVRCEPITYEDFLPVSAAGIFQSNLGDDAPGQVHHQSNQGEFEAALGCAVINEFEQYATLQKASINACLQQLA